MPGLAPSTRPFRCTENRGQTPILFFLLSLPLMAGAEDLIQVYRDAQRYDAVYAAARHTLAAGRERLPQGRALLLPALNLSASKQQSRVDSESRDPAVTPSFIREPRSSGYDLIVAQEIAALNDVESKRQALRLITGKEYSQLKPLRAEIKLAPPNPQNMETWVELAEKQNYAVQIQEATNEVAALEARRARAAH